MASAGTPVSKRRRSDTSSCSPLSVTARRLLVAKCARGGTLVAHSSSWKSEIRETVAARLVCHCTIQTRRRQKAPGEHRRRTGMPEIAGHSEYASLVTAYFFLRQ